MSRTLDDPTLCALGVGAAVLSAGGVSAPQREMRLAQQLMQRTGPVRLVPADTLPDSGWVALVAMAGSPVELEHRPATVEQFARPVQLLTEVLGLTFCAVMGAEIGGVNAIVPVLVAAQLGLPLVDAETLGRSFPAIHMSRFAIEGVAMTPMALTDPRGNDVIVHRAGPGAWIETITRQVAVAYGSIVAVGFPAHVADVRRHAFRGTYSRAIRIGQALALPHRPPGDALASLLAAESGIELFRGRIASIERNTSGGFQRGAALVSDASGEHRCRVEFQNEYSVVSIDGVRVSTTPDLINLFDAATSQPLGNEALQVGRSVVVASLPPEPFHLSERALAVVGPRGFGHDFDYVSAHPGVRTA